jgi:hypothetical protein
MKRHEIGHVHIEQASKDLDVELTWTDIRNFVSHRLLIHIVTTPFVVTETLVQTAYRPILRNSNKNSPEGSIQCVWDTDLSRSRWSTLRAICEREGIIRTLWRGMGNGMFYDVLTLFIEPTLEDVLYHMTTHLSDLESPSFRSLGFTVPFTAHVFTCFLLSPLALLRTRLIVQRDYKYSGLFHGIRTVIQEEGFTALFKAGLVSVFYHGTTLVLRTGVYRWVMQEMLSPLRKRAPILFGLTASLVLIGMELAISLPLLNIKRRLECSRTIKRYPVKLLDISPSPYPLSKVKEERIESFAWQRHFHCKDNYSGLWNCLTHICKEEGWISLYRGWELRVLSNLCEAALISVTTIEIQGDDGLF